jgi:tetratricopeptide (TPR) repeat protein
MVGNPARRAHFGELTALLRQGQTAGQAFTNTFRTPLPVIEQELAHYLHEGRFESLGLAVRASLLTSQPLVSRGIGPAECCFRLGDALMRVGREDQAESLFLRARELAPASPLSCEGLGLLAAERDLHPQALESLKEAIRQGSKSFLVHYAYAREKLILSAPAPDTYTRLSGADATEVEKELVTSLELMPEFGSAQHLLGFFQLIQGENLTGAEQHLKKAIELEPENQDYLLTLAQVELAQRNQRAARLTLEALCRPYVNAKVRAHAEKLLSDSIKN